MKFHNLILGLIFFALPLTGERGNRPVSLRQVTVAPFQRGEQLTYDVSYGFFNVGTAQLSIGQKKHYNGKEIFHLKGSGKSNAFWDPFFKVRDYYDSYIDAKTWVPLYFNRDILEGKYTLKRNITFDHKQHLAVDQSDKSKGPFSIPENCQDLLSAFYFSRTFETASLVKGQEIDIQIFIDHELFSFKLKVLGFDKIKYNGKKVPAIKIRPLVQKGRVFKEEESMTLWVSRDENKIPLLLKSNLRIGSVTMELAEAKGLKHRL